MPTNADFKELIENTKTRWIENYNGAGVKGRLFIAENGESIFLPAAGYRDSGTEHFDASAGGYYWSNTLRATGPDLANFLGFREDDVGVHETGNRCSALTIRPVRP